MGFFVISIEIASIGLRNNAVGIVVVFGGVVGWTYFGMKLGNYGGMMFC